MQLFSRHYLKDGDASIHANVATTHENHLASVEEAVRVLCDEEALAWEPTSPMESSRLPEKHGLSSRVKRFLGNPIYVWGQMKNSKTR